MKNGLFAIAARGWIDTSYIKPIELHGNTMNTIKEELKLKYNKIECLISVHA